MSSFQAWRERCATDANWNALDEQRVSEILALRPSGEPKTGIDILANARRESSCRLAVMKEHLRIYEAKNGKLPPKFRVVRNDGPEAA